MTTTLAANIDSITKIIRKSHVVLHSLHSLLSSPPKGLNRVAEEVLRVGPDAIDANWARDTMLDETSGQWLAENIPDTIQQIDAARVFLNQTAEAVRPFATDTAAVDDANVWLDRVAIFLDVYWFPGGKMNFDDSDWSGTPCSPAQRWAANLFTKQRIVFEKSLKNETAGELTSINQLLNMIDCDKLINRLRVEAARALLVPASEEVSGNPGESCHSVVKRLFGWHEILNAIDRPDSDEGRVKSLNKQFDGPIITRQGGDPACDLAKLISWWNGLEACFAESQQRETDRKATTEGNASYNYGKDGAVVPEISGSVKSRRKNPRKTP